MFDPTNILISNMRSRDNNRLNLQIIKLVGFNIVVLAPCMIVGVIGLSRRICIIELSDRQINRELMIKGRYEQLQNVSFLRCGEKSLLSLSFVVS